MPSLEQRRIAIRSVPRGFLAGTHVTNYSETHYHGVHLLYFKQHCHVYPIVHVMCFHISGGLRIHLSQQHLGHYYKPCESAFFRLPLSPIARYPSLLSTSPFLVTGISHVAICYSTLSTPLILRTIKPCELRNFLHKQISPCELRLT